MRIQDILILAWDQIKRRKVVTALCVTGISIGCASLIVAISVGESAQQYSLDEMNRNFKMNEITVKPNVGISTKGNGTSKKGNFDRGKLSEQKIELIKKLPHVTAVAPSMKVESFEMITIDNKISYVEVIGTDLQSLTSFDNTFAQGGPSDADGTVVLNYGATIGLMDNETVNKMMQRLQEDPYNDSLLQQFNLLNMKSSKLYQQQIQYRYYNAELQQNTLSSSLRVTGILKQPTGIRQEEAAYDKKAYVSLGTAQLLLEEFGLKGETTDTQGYDSILVKVDSQDNVAGVEGQIKKLILSTETNLHHQVEVNKKFNMIKKTALGIGLFVLVIASISIIVAMTMSTHQRRRQIGIMKVLGSNLWQIRNMFIAEAALLGLLGGGIGVLISYLTISGVNKLLATTSIIPLGESTAGMVISISLKNIPLGISFAVMTGVLSGIYPAISASNTNALVAIKKD
ncbi:ABC transporter permease [Paenibacillus odorifer]|uniref:ABC transporter permease n=1 Tax=Paenibacillus odorifer TaxID=189426 RepID=UPI0004F5A916|nr:FtsX-like permease family protein [Paenibacillus odorifer]AIQ73408.1 ABC transporter permease [Paenibacillus odorifer]